MPSVIMLIQMERRSKRIYASLVISAVVLASAIPLVYQECGPRSEGLDQHKPLGLLVPLYFDPNGSWEELIAEHIDYPQVPIIAIINPDNGPGSNYSSQYESGISSLEKSGIMVVGYIYTSYGNVPWENISAQVLEYKHFYNVSGIFLDEVGDNSTTAAYYGNITSLCRSLGGEFIVGNPGTYSPESITGDFNLTVLYENPGLPAPNNFSSITNGTSRNSSALIAVSSGLPGESWFQSADIQFSYVYITNFGLPNPYLSLPTYLRAEMSDLSLM